MMKFTTLNFKNEDYIENHEIIVGTHIGCLKRIDVSNENPYSQENLQDLKSLKKDSMITALNFNNPDKNELLIGRANKFAEVYNLSLKEFSNNIEFSGSPIIGICRYEDKFIAGLENGNIEISQNDLSKQLINLNAGDHISKMCQCQEDHRFVATGGKERQNNLKVFNLETKQKIFTSKNLPNDYLQLEVPIWDTDVNFLKENLLTTCSRYGYIRLYDIRAQRRPIKKYSNDQLNFSCMASRENYVYVGTIKGELKAFDTRNLKTFVHTYKGCTGSVSDVYLDDTGKYLISANLDRYVRVHNADNCVLLYQCYVKTKAMRVLVRNIENNRIVQEYENTELLTKKNKNVIDKEYEEIFDNMETITENEEKDNSTLLIKRKNSKNKNLKVKRKKI